MRHCIGLEYVLSPRSSFLNLSAQIDYQEAGLSAVFDSILLRVRGEMRRLFVFHDSQMLLKGLFVAFFNNYNPLLTRCRSSPQHCYVSALMVLTGE